MELTRLSLLHFRNYASLNHAFSPGLNLLVGGNAQGKSNLLEAIYLLATTKSMRGARDTELISWSEPTAVVTGRIRRERQPDAELEVVLSRAGPKLLATHGARAARVMDFVGQLQVVAFCAADLEIVRGEPARRRRFLDLEISQISPRYCHALGCYKRVVEQRAQLLRATRDRRVPGLEAMLAPWTEQLVRYGAQVVERRQRYISELAERAVLVHEDLTEGRERLDISYRCSFPLAGATTLDATEIAFREALERAAGDERRRGLCLVGPHRDDLGFLFDGHDARPYGSQGQQRTIALSVRLAELDLLREETGEAPLCLLDDVLSDLDERRRTHLFERVGDRCQTFVTCVRLAALPTEIQRRGMVYHVEAGAIHVPNPLGSPAPA
ncbi:MAG: DNA replication/repair protein RecF [Armatimonadetes bacterium]|nr:DNA replication/repair protein RecF [Armatimonadota bacterium]